MEKFSVLDAVAVPLDMANVDTDQFCPSRFLRKPRKDGFAPYLFHDLRFNADESEKPEFPLNQEPFRKARIIVSDRNFGCGSAREHAVWGMYDYGFRAAIAPSFGDAFFNNSYQNGLLPLRVDPDQAAAWRGQLKAKPGTHMVIDLAAQTIVGPDGGTVRFEIDPFRKQCLLDGVDEIGFTLGFNDRIAAYERQRDAVVSWL
jgi:3-isopropylmalate/(R)-2-methylmalate dehydratase small subunit